MNLTYYIVTGIIFLIMMNISGYVLMGIDKKKAIKKRWRVPEKLYFSICFLGGCVGTYAGMYKFRHKTKHSDFVIGIPLIFTLHVVLVIVALFYFL